MWCGMDYMRQLFGNGYIINDDDEWIKEDTHTDYDLMFDITGYVCH